MASQQSIVYRVGVGKALGFLVGFMGFVLIPEFVTDPPMTLRIGVLLWYVTFGAIIGVFGVFAVHPVLKLALPWWARGTILGAWINLVVMLIAFDQISVMTITAFGEYSAYASPYWMVLEGAIVGFVMDYFLTRWFGEGVTG